MLITLATVVFLSIFGFYLVLNSEYRKLIVEYFGDNGFCFSQFENKAFCSTVTSGTDIDLLQLGFCLICINNGRFVFPCSNRYSFNNNKIITVLNRSCVCWFTKCRSVLLLLFAISLFKTCPAIE
jgi:hypothetical protein